MDGSTTEAAEERHTTREPTEAELRGMARYFEEAWGFTEEHARLEAEELEARAAVFPDYMSDGPGYVGPVLVVLGGEPNAVMSFTLEHQQDGTVEVRRADR